MKVNSGKHLLELKDKYQDLMAPRSIGNMANDEVVTICIKGNEKADYTEVSRAIYELRKYVNSLNGDRAKILYEDDPKQKENFNFHITYKFSIEVDSTSIYSKKIRDLIQEIYTLRSKDSSVKNALKQDPNLTDNDLVDSKNEKKSPSQKDNKKKSDKPETLSNKTSAKDSQRQVGDKNDL